jgi:hypothetical protein
MNSNFFRKSRSIFGSSLLSMNSNTIRSLCKSSRFHLSIKTQHFNILKIETNCLLNNNMKQNNLEGILQNELLEKNENNLNDIEILELITTLINKNSIVTLKTIGVEPLKI